MHRFIVRITLAAVVLSLALASAGALTAAPPSAYTVTPLVSDVPGAAAATDPNLVNGWGLARSATSPWWVADNGAGDGKSTLYTGAGAIIPLVVNVAGGPTGAVFAGVADNFLVATDADPTLARASFIFDNEDGNILAWTAAAVRGRLPQRARRRLRRKVAERHTRGIVRRPGASRGLRAVRDPDDRLARLRLVRKAGRRRGGRARRTGARLRRCVRPPGQPGWTRPRPRSAQRAVGPRGRAGHVRQLRRRPARGQLRRRPDQRLRGERGRRLRASRHAHGRRREEARDRRAVGARVRQRRQQRHTEPALLLRRPGRRVARALREHQGRLAVCCGTAGPLPGGAQHALRRARSGRFFVSNVDAVSPVGGSQSRSRCKSDRSVRPSEFANPTVSEREIVRRLGMNRRTVARLARSEEPPRYRRAPTGSQLDPFEPVLRRLLAEWPAIKAPRLTEILRGEYGYTGSVRLVQEHLQRLRPSTVRPAQRTGYRPGQVLQLDWAEMPTRPRLAGRERRVYALLASLPYSGAQTGFFSLDLTLESFLEGHVRAFEWLGGVPRECVTTICARSSPAAKATR